MNAPGAGLFNIYFTSRELKGELIVFKFGILLASNNRKYLTSRL